MSAASSAASPVVHEERELKFAVDDDFLLPSFESLPHHPVTVPSPPEVLHATYYDTPDLRLARWGVTIRFRSDDGWTLKLPHGKRTNTLTRDEVYVAGTPDRVPAQARDIVRALTRNEALVAVATLTTTRRRRELVALDGTRLAVITDDVVRAQPREHTELRFHEVEIELTDIVEDALVERIVGRMLEAGAAQPDLVPKLVRALGRAAAAPPEVTTTETLESDATGADLVRAAIAASVARLLRYDPRVRVGGDSENVHQARVATRRLRSDLRTFRPLLDREWCDALRSDLADVATALGAVRDNEVLAERIRDAIEHCDADTAADAAPLLIVLEREHVAGRAALLQLMNTDRYFTLVDQLVDAARRPSVRGRAATPAAELVPTVMNKPWRALTTAVAALDGNSPDADLHHARILAKRVRYAAEALVPSVGRAARTFAKRVTALQTVLGDHQDAVVCAAWLRAAAPTLPERARIAALHLAAEQDDLGKHHRAEWMAAWNRANDSTLRTWWTS
ncbi:MAG: CHAD domain-containing protein [Acidimicrobiia bacterium]